MTKKLSEIEKHIVSDDYNSFSILDGKSEDSFIYTKDLKSLAREWIKELEEEFYKNEKLGLGGNMTYFKAQIDWIKKNILEEKE